MSHNNHIEFINIFISLEIKHILIVTTNVKYSPCGLTGEVNIEDSTRCLPHMV